MQDREALHRFQYEEVDDTGPRLFAKLAQVFAHVVDAWAVVWRLLLHDIVPAVLAWAAHSFEQLDLVSPLVSPGTHQPLERLGLFLSVVAAIVTTESYARDGYRAFRLPHFLLTMATLAVVIFPFLAHRHGIALGLTPEQFTVLMSYSYFALKVVIGVLIGATVSWMLSGRHAVTYGPRPTPTRK